MKTANKLVTALFVVAIAASGCKKDIEPVSKVVEVTYPSVELIGPAHVLIPVGGSYTDEGATLTDDISGQQSTIMASASEVDPSTPGLYAMTYEAANSNGFRATATRSVLVLDYTPTPGLTVNLAGEWLREATGVSAIWTEMAQGLYIIDYAGGVTATPVYAIQTADDAIDIPVQTTWGGLALEGTDEALDYTSDTTVTYRIMASGFGTGLRTFVKQ